jgi:phospholipase C
MRSNTTARRLRLPAAALAMTLLAGCALPPLSEGDMAAKAARVRNVVVIYAENHSFDNLYGLFPGANGIANASTTQRTQVDHDGTPLRELIVFGADGKPNPAFPRLPNGPFRIDAPPVDRPPDTVVPSPIHDFFYHQEQINGGRNDMFAAMSQVGGWTMGHYDGSVFKLWQWAKEYTLADNFFQAAFGGSYLNHQWLICACTPVFPDAPESMRVRLDAKGKLEKKKLDFIVANDVSAVGAGFGTALAAGAFTPTAFFAGFAAGFAFAAIR